MQLKASLTIHDIDGEVMVCLKRARQGRGCFQNEMQQRLMLIKSGRAGAQAERFCKDCRRPR